MAKQQTVEVEETEAEVVTDESLSDSLKDVFDDSKEEAKAEPEDEKGDAKVEVKTEKVEKAETEEGEPDKTEKPVETPSTESIGLQAALVAERQKRQAAEDKLKSLEEPEKIPDPIEDPEGYADHVKTESSKGLLDTRINLSRDLMIDSKEDYLEKEAVFMGLIGSMDDGKLVITDDLLFKKFQESKNPARFAYNHAVDHLLAEQYKNPDFEKNLEAKLREKILAEMKGEKPKEGLSAVEVPDLTKATASGSNTEPVEREVTEINQLFPDPNL